MGRETSRCKKKTTQEKTRTTTLRRIGSNKNDRERHEAKKRKIGRQEGGSDLKRAESRDSAKDLPHVARQRRGSVQVSMVGELRESRQREERIDERKSRGWPRDGGRFRRQLGSRNAD